MIVVGAPGWTGGGRATAPRTRGRAEVAAGVSLPSGTVNLEALTALLMRNGFVAADEEAEELLAAAGGDTDGSTRWSSGG